MMNKLINNTKALHLTLVFCVIAVAACTLEDDIETLRTKMRNTPSSEISKAILELIHNSKVIGNNDPEPIDFGNVEITTSKSLLFTIKNAGNLPLELNGTPVILSSNSVFTIPIQPTITSIIPGSSVGFLILYTPTAEKEDNGTITIMNNSDALIFTLNIKGTGYITRPRITVRQGSTAINQSGEYAFGTVVLGESKDITFNIGNSGEANLVFETVNDNRVNLENNAGNIFTVIAQPSSTMAVAPGGTTTFSIRFNPVAAGSNFNAIVKIKTNSRINNEFSFMVKGSSILAVPSGVTAVFQPPDSILVSWNPVQEAAGYKVYYGTSSSAITILAGSAVTETSYIHTGLSTGTTYYYCITAQSGMSESDRSQAVSMRTLPGIPANLRSTASTHNSTTIAWNAVTGAASYNVYFAASVDGSKTFAGTVSSGTSYNHTNLSANTTRYYFVTAVNSTGEGAYTEALTVRTLMAPLSAPNNVTAMALSTSSIQVTWDAVTEAVNYKIYRSTSATGTRTLLDTITATSFTSGGLTERTYWYFVTALNTDTVESALSASASMIPMPSVPTVSVSALELRVGTYVRWDNKGDYSYRVYFATSLTGTKTLAGTSTGSSYTHDELQGNTTYYYWVIAVNAGGESEYSLPVSAVTAPAAPTNFRQTANTTTSVTLAWNAVPGATRYELYRYWGSNNYLALGSTTATSAMITDLNSNTTYLFFCKA
jgi:fibronectin type 3 domain-containing protein